MAVSIEQIQEDLANVVEQVEEMLQYLEECKKEREAERKEWELHLQTYNS